ncbi:MAG: 3-dehydroquinate synthase [Planctomycetota bacterium]|nr:MAG: 3-dehydroquinate synthase [Planctomycetota bacterium]
MTGRPSQSVRVSLGERAYHVEIGVGLLGALGASVRDAVSAAPRRAFLVADDNLPHELVGAAVSSLDEAGFAVTTERVVATESNKSVATLERLLASLARSRHERGEPVVALGGGIVGDLAGFAAAVYRRGVPVIQCPTTLLAMVDASVGGKTGVNLSVGGALLKNMAGAFWQPRRVLADVAALRSLGDRQFRAGLAECLKHGLIAGRLDPALAEWTAGALPSLHCRDEGALVKLIGRNVAVKARVVEADEREAADGGRALLNLGHTYAHAIETIPHLTPDGDAANAPLLHGEAVALGLIAAGAAAEALGRVESGFVDRLRALVADAGLPIEVAGLPDSAELTDAMTHDKKVAGGRLRLVLPTGAGLAEVVSDPPMSAVGAGFDAIRASS